jgi:hypothetical protein
VTVALGGLGNSTVIDISGGWRRQFSLNQTSDVTVFIVYQVEIGLWQNESQFVQALCSLDGNLLGKNATVDFLAELHGNGTSTTIGYEMITLSVPSVPVGAHTIAIGGYANQRNAQHEMAWVRFDMVMVTAIPQSQRLRRRP